MTAESDVSRSDPSDRSGRGAERPIRVIVAKGGLDAHERGAHVVVLGLREAGFEVIYLGLRRTPEEIWRAAVQEDVDVVGISSLSGSSRNFMSRLLELRSEIGSRALVVVGGLVDPADQVLLKEAGVSAIYGQGTLVSHIADSLRQAVRARDNGDRATS